MNKPTYYVDDADFVHSDEEGLSEICQMARWGHTSKIKINI